MIDISMHRRYPMAGHILPVIFSWHFKMQIDAVAGSFTGALDPSEVWRAWAAGAQCPKDSFSPDWNFWDHVATPIDNLRQDWLLPPGGLSAIYPQKADDRAEEEAGRIG